MVHEFEDSSTMKSVARKSITEEKVIRLHGNTDFTSGKAIKMFTYLLKIKQNSQSNTESEIESRECVDPLPMKQIVLSE